MKQAVGHRRIQQGGDDAAVKDARVPLKSLVRIEVCPHGTVRIGLERQLQGPWIPLAAQQAVVMVEIGISILLPAQLCTSIAGMIR